LDRPLAGIGRYTLQLGKALLTLQDRLEIVLLTAGGAGALAGQNGTRYVPLSGCRLLPGLMTLGNVLIPRLAKKLELDLFHDPSGVTPLLFGAGRARTVITVHDVFAWSCPGTSNLLDTVIYRHWLPRVLPGVDAVITDSQASKTDISKYLGVPSSKVNVIHLGVDGCFHPVAGELAATVGRSHGLPDRYVLYLGSVEKRKNLSTLLRAYAHLRRLVQVPKLVIVGAKRHRSAGIEEILQELALVEHVLFPGYVPDEDLPALYSGADLFVFPSLYEGFGLPPLEAMACGTPVVTSNVSSLPEVVGDAAITVTPYDVEALAEAMRRVLTDADLRAELREKGLARAKQFTWERCAQETLAVYEQVLA
jgi:glycosyltransferase involved in cell wall biosynthesis